MKSLNNTSCRRTTCAALAALAAMLCTISITPAYAGKPGGGGTPVDTGTIYFRAYNPSFELWTMKPDGSGKTKVPVSLPTPIVEPSQSRHNTQRWFLFAGPIPNEAYPDGRPRYELFALSESGTSVQVTADPTVQPLLTIDDEYVMPRWINWTGPDTRVSYLG